MKNINLQILIAGLSVVAVGCSGLFQKSGGLVRRGGQEQVCINCDPDTGLKISGATTMAALTEVVDRAENAIVGSGGTKLVSRNTGVFQTAVNLSRDNFFANRDPALVSSSGVMAALQVIHGACAALSTANLNSQFGINTGLSLAANRTALVAYGVKLIENTTQITSQINPDLIAQVSSIVDAQVSELQSATYPAGTNQVQAAAVSVCTAAIMAGGFGIGG